MMYECSTYGCRNWDHEEFIAWRNGEPLCQKCQKMYPEYRSSSQLTPQLNRATTEAATERRHQELMRELREQEERRVTRERSYAQAEYDRQASMRQEAEHQA